MVTDGPPHPLNGSSAEAVASDKDARLAKFVSEFSGGSNGLETLERNEISQRDTTQDLFFNPLLDPKTFQIQSEESEILSLVRSADACFRIIEKWAEWEANKQA